MKDLIKNWAHRVPMCNAKNHEYHWMITKLMKEYLNEDSNCIDVGGDKGVLFDEVFSIAPLGVHTLFEPVVESCNQLQQKYAQSTNCNILNAALSDKNGISSFNLSLSNPEKSSFKKVDKIISNGQNQLIFVETVRLDDALSERQHVDLINIDIDGGIYTVLQGASKTIERNRPLVTFRFNTISAEVFGTTPSMIHDYFSLYNMHVYPIQDFVQDKAALTLPELEEHLSDGSCSWFVGHL